MVAGKSESPVSEQLDGVAEAAYNVKYKQFEAYGKVLGRTDENRFRQPSDRITANVKYGPWASLKAGDVYPLYNPLLLNGTRVRGAEAAMNLTLEEAPGVPCARCAAKAVAKFRLPRQIRYRGRKRSIR